jgi:hypothetical protein
MLITYQAGYTPRVPASGVRLSIRDGTTERLPDAGARGLPLILTEPWVRASEQ